MYSRYTPARVPNFLVGCTVLGAPRPTITYGKNPEGAYTYSLLEVGGLGIIKTGVFYLSGSV